MSTSDDQPPGDAGNDVRPEGVDPLVLLRELASSDVLVPQEPLADGGEPPEGTIALPVVEQGDTQFVPVFTSEEALSAAKANPDAALQIPLAELAAGWPSDDLWLAVDPGSESGLTLPPDVVRALPRYVQTRDAEDVRRDGGQTPAD